MIFYSTKIFTEAGISKTDAPYATLGIGAINVVMTVISMMLVEKAGRKTLLLIGFGGMAVDTLLLTVALNFVVSRVQFTFVTVDVWFSRAYPR